MIRRVCFVALCVLLATNGWSESRADESLPILPVYVYHLEAPFLINSDTGSGINRDFGELLKKHLGQRQIDIRPVSRSRLNSILANDEPAIVLWSNPVWFEREGRQYLWTEPLFVDQDVVVYERGVGRNIKTLNGIEGLKVGGRQGYFYVGLDDLVSQNRVLRVDVDSDWKNLENLLAGSIDVAVISKSSLLYYVQLRQLENRISLADYFVNSYERRILVSHHFKEFKPELDRAVKAILADSEWRRRLELLGLSKVGTAH